jgi:hypothetical protein
MGKFVDMCELVKSLLIENPSFQILYAREVGCRLPGNSCVG